MLQDIGSGRFHNQFLVCQPESGDYVLLYDQDCAAVFLKNRQLSLPCFADLPQDVRDQAFHYAFSIDQHRYFLGSAKANIAAPIPGTELVPSREYRNMQPQETAFACCVGESLHRWLVGNQYCGRCGAKTEESTKERALVCPKCGHTVYPKICPAIIAAVRDGERLLLTKYRGRAFKRFALVAGFNEIGESIEETVHREVLEETGLRVKNLRFYKSQPWILTDSLLMGFFCDLDGSAEIHMQEDELSVAQWFARSEIPTDYSAISLTGEMIEAFRRGIF